MYDHELYLHTLGELTTKISAGYAVEAVLDELTGPMTDVLGLAGVGLSLERRGRLEFHAGHGHAVGAVERAQEEAQEGPGISAFETGSVVAVDDLAAQRPRWPRYCVVAATVDISAVASIPMRHGNQALGVIGLYGHGPRDWPSVDLRAACVVANIVAAFVVDAVHADDRSRQAERIRHLQRALDSRVDVEQAKGVLAARHGIDPDGGFERLRRHARDHNAPLREVARAVVEGRLDI